MSTVPSIEPRPTDDDPVHPPALAAAGAEIARTSRSRWAGIHLAIWDALVPLALFGLTGWIADLALLGDPWTGPARGSFAAPALGMSAVAVVAIGLRDGYRDARRLARDSGRRPGRLAAVAILSGWGAVAASAVSGESLDMGQLAAVVVLATPAWLLGRAVARTLLVGRTDRAVVVGSGVVARRIVEITQRQADEGTQIIGLLADDEVDRESEQVAPILGRPDDLVAVVRAKAVDRVIVAFTERADTELLEIVRRCDALGVTVDLVPRLFDMVGPAPQARDFGGLALMEVTPSASPAESWLKRAIDIVGASTLLLATGPALVLIAAAIRMNDGGPIFYRQMRIGRRGERFGVVKFRTMRVNADRDDAAHLSAVESGETSIEQAVADIKGRRDPRVTPVGRVLRATSLDELPQLLNVLGGQMSLVGPRPLREFEVRSLTDWQLSRQDARPGITGLWQVLGRSDIMWSERLQLDYDYVRHWSLALDFRIMLRTLPAVIRRKGAV